MKHNRIIRREFSKQAPRFGEKGLSLSRQDLLAWILDRLPLEKESLVLDVAAGTGHLSLALAPHVKHVVALDITREMLAIAREETAKRTLNNVLFEEGNAEHLPHAANRFDLVVSRLSLHHFEQPEIQLREMVRVCKPAHTIGIIDLLAPEEETVARIYNDLERLRDPSHTLALSGSQMEASLASVGIQVEKIEKRDVEVDFERWARMTGTKPETVAVLQKELRKDIAGGAPTGMRPFMKNGSLQFLQVWSITVGTKIMSTKHSRQGSENAKRAGP